MHYTITYHFLACIDFPPEFELQMPFHTFCKTLGLEPDKQEELYVRDVFLSSIMTTILRLNNSAGASALLPG